MSTKHPESVRRANFTEGSMNKTTVELTIRYGNFQRESKTVSVDLCESISREIFSGVERSNEPLSMFLASPGVYGGKGSSVSIREEAFHMRRAMAREIADSLVTELLKAFGVNDQLDGYSIDRMSSEEREYHRSRGRL